MATARGGRRKRLRICTWNVNSVRLRLDHLPALAAAAKPDVLCLQETKVIDDAFPRQAFADAGYRHALIKGMKNYNGVAILSRRPLQPVDVPDWCGRQDCRHLAAMLDGPAGPLELHNFYVPAGGDVPDPEQNDRFKHKLAFLDAMRRWFKRTRGGDKPMVLVGDLNVAPGEHDVWSHKQLLKIVSHTPVETTRLDKLRDDLGWTDSARHFVPADEKLYSWWSYRARDWRAADKGRRLDHIWVTPPLQPYLKSMQHLKDARDWRPPSDHVPVVLELAG
jgi:exodeoxyribonuclease-3